MKQTTRTAVTCMAMLFALSANAASGAKAEARQTIELKDGTTLYIFKDGKMAMEDKNGRARAMEPGVVMEGKDGQRYIMVGNEVAQLRSLLRHEQGGSGGGHSGH